MLFFHFFSDLSLLSSTATVETTLSVLTLELIISLLFSNSLSFVGIALSESPLTSNIPESVEFTILLL
jgi:hypothetical protein